jgi:hypothetical protein
MGQEVVSRVKKSRNTVPLNWAISPSPHPIIEVTPKVAEIRGIRQIPQYGIQHNSAEF